MNLLTMTIKEQLSEVSAEEILELKRTNCESKMIKSLIIFGLLSFPLVKKMHFHIGVNVIILI